MNAEIKFSKTWPDQSDPLTDHVVETLPDGTAITRDGYILEAAPIPPITKPDYCIAHKVTK